MSHKTPAEPQCIFSDKLLEVWLLILQCFARSFHYLTYDYCFLTFNRQSEYYHVRTNLDSIHHRTLHNWIWRTPGNSLDTPSRF